jgi:hypothetical protein
MEINCEDRSGIGAGGYEIVRVPVRTPSRDTNEAIVCGKSWVLGAFDFFKPSRGRGSVNDSKTRERDSEPRAEASGFQPFSAYC